MPTTWSGQSDFTRTEIASLENAHDSKGFNYFAKLIALKRKEFYFVIKEKLGVLVFEYLRASPQHSLINNQEQKPTSKIASSGYFLNSIRNFCKQADYSDFSTGPCTVSQVKRVWAKANDSLTQMIQFFFDDSLFRTIRKEASNSANYPENEEMQLIEIIECVKACDWADKVLSELSASFAFKFEHCFAELVYLFNDSLTSGDKVTERVRFAMSHPGAATLNDLSDFKVGTLFGELIMKLAVLVFSRVAIVVKTADLRKAQLCSEFFKAFFGQLKGLFFTVLNAKIDKGAKVETSLAAEDEQQTKRVELTKFQVLVAFNKLDQRFPVLAKRFVAFVEDESVQEQLGLEFKDFQTSVFAVFSKNLIKVFEKNLVDFKTVQSVKSAFQEEETVAHELALLSMKNRDEVSEILNRSVHVQSFYFQSLASEKINQPPLSCGKAFLNDFNLVLSMPLTRTNESINLLTLELMNKISASVVQFLDSNLEKEMLFGEFVKVGTPESWISWKAKAAEFLEQLEVNRDKLTEEEYMDESDKKPYFDFKGVVFCRFWESTKQIEFVETVLAAFEQLFGIYSVYSKNVTELGSLDNQSLLKRCLESLGAKFDTVSPKENLKVFYDVCSDRSRLAVLVKKLKQNMLTEAEIVTLWIGFCDVYFRKCDAYLFFIKFCFEFMLSSHQDQMLQRLSKLELKEKRNFNRMDLVQDLSKLLVSMDRLFSKYISLSSVKELFVLDTIHTFFRNMDVLALTVPEIFLGDKSLLKSFYSELVSVLNGLKLFEKKKDIVLRRGKNYKRIKPFVFLTKVEQLDEVAEEKEVDMNSIEVTITRKRLTGSA